MTHFPTGLATAVILALTGAAGAQVRTFDMSNQRESTGLFYMLEDSSPGSFVIDYGAPEWKADYVAMIDGDGAGVFRLGRNQWTSLDNSIPLQFGDVRLGVGHWYLALARSADGKWMLNAYESARVRRAKVSPSQPDAVDAQFAIPLSLAKKDSITEKLEIAVQANEGKMTGSLAVTWGPYMLTTDFEAVVAKSRKDHFDAAIADMVKLANAKEFGKLIRTYADPEFVKREGDAIDEMVEEFAASEKAQQLIKVLQAVMKKDVAVADDATEISVEDESFPRDITFEWLDGRWYLKN